MLYFPANLYIFKDALLTYSIWKFVSEVNCGACHSLEELSLALSVSQHFLLIRQCSFFFRGFMIALIIKVADSREHFQNW